MAIMSLPFSHINSGVIVSRQGLSTNPTSRSLRAKNCKKDTTIEPGAKQDELLNAANNDVETYGSQMAQQLQGTPLLSALKATAEDNAASFHFPGHNRGLAAPSLLTQLFGEKPFLYDLTPMPPLGNLFASEGPIFEAQKLAAELFGASETWFLVGGTSCGVHAAIMGTCCPGDTLILPRNAHISAISAMVLSGAVPKYIVPDYDLGWDIATTVSPLQVEKAIRELEVEGRKPAAVFITSPTYQGICSNLSEISLLCHMRGIPLIVDEAHGAHFGFHPHLPIRALQQGADIVVQSTHKVLCSLSQSSMLHVSRSAGKRADRDKISKCLQALESTSPSHLLLASLDAATARLRDSPQNFFDSAINLALEAKHTIKEIMGVSVLDFKYPAIVMDPLRVTLGFGALGLSGYEASDLLYEHHRIVPELIGSHSITFIFTPGTCREHVQRLLSGLKHLSMSSYSLPHKRKTLRAKYANLKAFNDINIQLTPREAFFAKKTKVDISISVGKVSGELIWPYPPGIPILIPGEVISERVLDALLQSKTDGAFVMGASDPLLSSIVICDV